MTYPTTAELPIRIPALHEVPDLARAMQRKRAAELELMLDLQRELLQSNLPSDVPDQE